MGLTAAPAAQARGQRADAPQRRAVDPVTSTSPATTATPTDMPSGYQVSTESPTAYQSIEVPDPTQAAYTPSPLPSDIEADPLTIRLVDKVPKEANGAIAYRVSVCVSSSSSSVGGDKVRIRRDNWSVGTFTSGTTARRSSLRSPPMACTARANARRDMSRSRRFRRSRPFWRTRMAASGGTGCWARHWECAWIAHPGPVGVA